MGYAYEAIVQRMDPREASAGFFEACSEPIPVEVVALGPELSVVFPTGSRDDLRFPKQMDSIAQALSATLPVLIVEWDDRVGHCASRLYIAGSVAVEFGEADEVWVPLDESGRPNLEGPRLALSELNDDDEYDVIQNAIDLGLQRLGGASWRELHDVITSK